MSAASLNSNCLTSNRSWSDKNSFCIDTMSIYIHKARKPCLSCQKCFYCGQGLKLAVGGKCFPFICSLHKSDSIPATSMAFKRHIWHVWAASGIQFPWTDGFLINSSLQKRSWFLELALPIILQIQNQGCPLLISARESWVSLLADHFFHQLNFLLAKGQSPV